MKIFILFMVFIYIPIAYADTCILTEYDSGIKDRPVITIDCTAPIYSNDTGEHSDSLYTADFNRVDTNTYKPK